MLQKRFELIAARLRAWQAAMRAASAAALANSPRIAARTAGADDCKVSPFGVFVRRRMPWHHSDDHARMFEGFRKPGWER